MSLEGERFDYGDKGNAVIMRLVYLGVGATIHPMIVKDAIYMDNYVYEVTLEALTRTVIIGTMRTEIQRPIILFLSEGDPYEVFIDDAIQTAPTKKSERKSNNFEAKWEAYSDPAVAAMAEFTTHGLKTRAGFYTKTTN